MIDKNIDDIKVKILKDENHHDLSFKIIIIGDPGVGKSCLTNQAIKNTFDETYSATVGFEFLTFILKLDEKIVKLQIWDTCGQEAYRSLISGFYRNASLAMIVYSIESRESFAHINTWLKDVHLLCNPDVKVFLIGNKADLEFNRAVSKDEAQKYAENNNFNYFNETSAKNGFNAKEVFMQAAKVLYLEHLKYKNRGYNVGNINSNNNVNSNNNGDVPMKINKENLPQRKKVRCC